jgi:hypothetical protein
LESQISIYNGVLFLSPDLFVFSFIYLIGHINDQPDYGIIGNCQSAALISRHGDIEWCYLLSLILLRFCPNSDEEKAFRYILLDDSYKKPIQKYIPNTTILVTEFDNGTDGFEFIDFMPAKEGDDKYYAQVEVVRQCKR